MKIDSMNYFAVAFFALWLSSVLAEKPQYRRDSVLPGIGDLHLPAGKPA